MTATGSPASTWSLILHVAQWHPLLHMDTIRAQAQSLEGKMQDT